MHLRFVLPTALLFIVFTGLHMLSQTVTPDASQPPSNELSLPHCSGILGRADPAATEELTAYLTVTRSPPSVGVQATGAISFGSTLTSTLPVTFTTLGHLFYRLDIVKPEGVESTRVHGLQAQMQTSDGKNHFLPSDTAMLTMFPYALVRGRVSAHPFSSLFDHGLVRIGGVAFHRITFEYATVGIDPKTKDPNTAAVDLYFDPSTHLLRKTVAEIMLPQTRTSRYLSVVTYDDYRPVTGYLLPFSFVETLDGEPFRALTFTTVILAPQITADYFRF